MSPFDLRAFLLPLLIPLATLLALTACSREQSVEVVQTAGKAYNASYRDNVIGNWQRRVKDTPDCEPFREQFKIEGEKYSSPASGAFVTAMQRVKATAAAAGCIGDQR